MVKRLLISLLLISLLSVIVGCQMVTPVLEQLEDKPVFECDGFIGVYGVDNEQLLREYDNTIELGDFGQGEYFSFCLKLRYNGWEAFPVDNLYVTVDNGDPWGWNLTELTRGDNLNLHIFHSNMQNLLTEGSHEVAWYLNDELLHTETFLITDAVNWQKEFPFPSAADISAHNQTSDCRSPYLAGWLDIPKQQRYSVYSIDFKADYLPPATYCCLSNWKMDYSALKETYVSYRTEYEHVQGYAGFQSLSDGKKVSIMSFWDIFCTDAQGNETVIRAKLLYPEAGTNNSFTGEGTGAHCLVPYQWEADHWYRMQLVCTNYNTTENTVVEQWVCDLNTGEWTLLCAYDTGVPNACFYGQTAVFLENFNNRTAGEVRTMEIRAPMYYGTDTGQWYAIPTAHVSSNGGLPNYNGSYRFGAVNNRLWMITSGTGGDWYNNGTGQKRETFNLS